MYRCLFESLLLILQVHTQKGCAGPSAHTVISFGRECQTVLYHSETILHSQQTIVRVLQYLPHQYLLLFLLLLVFKNSSPCILQYLVWIAILGGPLVIQPSFLQPRKPSISSLVIHLSLQGLHKTQEKPTYKWLTLGPSSSLSLASNSYKITRSFLISKSLQLSAVGWQVPIISPRCSACTVFS